MRPDGAYDLPGMTYSTVLAVTPGNRSNERQLVRQRLAEQAVEFSKLVIENIGRLR